MIGDKTRKAAWIGYDFANSAYVLIISAVAYPLYFRTLVVGGGAAADQKWGLVVSLSLLIAACISPFIGALVDVTGRRKLILTVSTLTCCLSAGALYFVPRGGLFAGAALFCLGQVAWVVSTTLYDSFLRELSSSARPSQSLSGLGWGLGYAGGILCLVVTYPLLKGGLAESNLASYRLAFVVTGLFYFLFALPALVLLPETRNGVGGSLAIALAESYRRVSATLVGWRNQRTLFGFLLGFYLLSDGITTIIYFTSIFLATTFHMPISKILIFTVVIQAIGIVTTPLFGLAAERFSEKRVLLVTSAIWCMTVVVMAFDRRPSAPMLMGCLIGTVIGSSQSICRGIYARLVPDGRRAEFFGFNAFAGRVATLLGPLTFGYVSSATGSQRAGLLSLLVFFVGGSAVINACRLDDGGVERSRENLPS